MPYETLYKSQINGDKLFIIVSTLLMIHYDYYYTEICL